MSAWTEMKVLRVPCSALGIEEDIWSFCEAREKKRVKAFTRGRGPTPDFPYFAPAPTEGAFLDYVLYESVTEQRGGFGRCRLPDAAEREQYLPAFVRYFPALDPERVHYVHFVFYDGSEAPDYYDLEEDPPGDE